MIAAFARASRVLTGRVSSKTYLEAATRAATFIRETMWRAEDRRLLRRYRDGEAALDAYAEDYACLVFGLLELFQASGEADWLEWAIVLQEQLDVRFWDDAEGGWFSTTGEDPTVLLRLKEDYDGAEPAASSVSALNLITLGHLTGDKHYFDRVERTLARYGPRAGAAARAIPLMLSALSAWHAEHLQVVIVGDSSSETTRALQASLATHYRPFALTIVVEPGPRQAALATRLPFIAAMAPRDGHAAAYVCRDFTCQAPVTDPAALAAQV
jgi:uncharacterized protein YyaL (SSP411 family)